MQKLRLFLWVCVAFCAAALHAQSDDSRTLFTVGGDPVSIGDFRYIYSKTNQDKADYTEQSVRDYLDLYIKFKLKVRAAREMRLDTIPTVKTELENYRRQLSNSYLVDREVSDKLVRETYERMKQDVDISYILVNCDRNASAADTLRAYRRILNIKKLLEKGADFAQVAADSSDDVGVRDNRGRLGFITAMLPDGYYDLERAVYDARPGQIVGPVRSNQGYHLALVHGFRPARGEVEVAQILLRKSDDPIKNQRVKARADSLYNALMQGSVNWDEACIRFSEDKMSASKGGYVGFFGINRYQKAFEDAAFALERSGQISAPVETTIGWHIIRLLNRRGIESFDNLKRPLGERIKRDSRSEVAKRSMINRIRKEAGFIEYPDALSEWAAMQKDSIFLTFRWKPDENKPNKPLLKIGEITHTVADFEEFCSRNSIQRMRGAGTPLNDVIQRLYADWANDVTMMYEEKQLDKKYPEFRNLMREYEEGILLFEALKVNVWDRANADTAGLSQYFNANLRDKYRWDERAVVSLYTLKSDDPKLLAEVRKYAEKNPADKTLKRFNKKTPMLTVIERTYEKGKNPELSELWRPNAMTAPKTDAGTKTASFSKIEKILPPGPKQLKDARGFAVADYQDYLEKKWIQDLQEKYAVKIDEAALKSMLK
ncbi:MAG: peptidylprolyl isomerase [Saprospiraceae bacterium]